MSHEVTSQRPLRRSVLRRLARLVPAAGRPPAGHVFIAGAALMLRALLMVIPLVVLWGRDANGASWWFTFAVLCLTLVVPAWLYGHPGSGARPALTSGLICAGVIGVALTLAAALTDSSALIGLLFAALAMVLACLYPVLHTGRVTAAVTAAMYGVLFGATVLAQLQLSPAHHLSRERMIAAVWPLGLVAGGVWYVSRVMRREAAAQQQFTGLALTDTVTGLPVRSAFFAEAERRVSQAAHGGPACTLVLADLDGLKDINDSFGHATGDTALRRLGEALRRRAGPHDIVARLGGDEFAVLGMHDVAGVQGVIDRFAPVLDATPYHDPATNHTIRLSASWGIATTQPGTLGLLHLFAQADEQLLRHKSSARQPAPPEETAELPFVPRGRRALAEALASLIVLARDVTAVTDGAEFVRQAATGAAALLGARSATITVVRGGERWGYRARRSPAGWIYEAAIFPGRHSIVQHVLDTGTPYVTNDVTQDPFADHDAAQRIGIHACLCVPVHGADSRVMGTLFLADKHGRAPYTDHDVHVAQALADLAGAALQKTEALAGAQAQTDTAERVLTVMARVQAHMPRDEMLALLLVEVAALTGAGSGLVALVEADGALRIRTRYHAPLAGDSVDAAHVSMALINAVAAGGAPMVTSAASGQPAALVVPVLGAAGRVLGVIGVAHQAPEGIFTTDQQALLEAVAAQVSRVLEARSTGAAYPLA